MHLTLFLGLWLVIIRTNSFVSMPCFLRLWWVPLLDCCFGCQLIFAYSNESNDSCDNLKSDMLFIFFVIAYGAFLWFLLGDFRSLPTWLWMDQLQFLAVSLFLQQFYRFCVALPQFLARQNGSWTRWLGNELALGSSIYLRTQCVFKVNLYCGNTLLPRINCGCHLMRWSPTYKSKKKRSVQASAWRLSWIVDTRLGRLDYKFLYTTFNYIW